MNPLEKDYLAYNQQYAIPGNYQTKLPSDQEKMFREWLKQVSAKAGRTIPANDPTYDMRGYWKNDVVGLGGDHTGVNPYDKMLHFPDTFKTPAHPTFSRESVYATPDAPYWEGDTLVDPKSGNPTSGFLLELFRRK